jgi:catalase
LLNGAYPKWTFGIQVIPKANEHDFESSIPEATTLWPEGLVPIRYIGELDDPLLQGHNFSYSDT